ncbi:MAG: ion transporter [Spirochaetaceae bacterium]|nr:ion transporter [Spirochaetaceae bacterium]
MMSKQQNVCDLVEKLTGIASMFSVFAFLLKFTPLCRFALPACYVFDILFVMLLFLRIKLYGFIEYLGSWQNIVDFFAAIPIAALFARHTELFQVIAPVGWFTIFRLLNIIPLVKKDSAFAQRHFKHICFSVILLEVVFILVLTYFFYVLFNKPLVEHYTAEYERFPSNPEYLMKNDENVVLVYKNGTIQSRKGFIRDKKTHFSICNSPYEYLIRIKFSKENILSDEKISAPKCGIIVSSPELLVTFNWLMIAIFLFVCGIFAVILWRDLLSKDGRKIAVAADAIKSGDFARFAEENAKIEKSGKDEIALLYEAIDSARHNFSPKTAELETAETAGSDEHGGFAKAIEELGEPESAGNVSAVPESAAEFAEPEKLADAIEELSELEEAETLESAEEAEAVAEAETSVEAESAEVAEAVEVLEEVAEPEALSEPIETLGEPAELEPHHSGGLLAAALKKQEQHCTLS